MISVNSQRKNEFYSELIEAVQMELDKIGIEKSSTIAEELIFSLYENWRGLSIVFPMNPERYIEKLKEKILEEFNGRNVTEIVRKYKISQNILYRWNSEAAKKRKEARA